MKKFIFDVHGTLISNRKKIEREFLTAFLIFCRHHDVYLVTGSNREKTIYLLGIDAYYSVKRVYNCSGCDVYERDINVYRDTWKPSDEVRQFLQHELDHIKFKLGTDPYIEERPGCINFSILGRGADWKEREEYKEHDKEEHEKIGKRFTQRFPDLYDTSGGQTGLAIAPLGRDKSQILRDFKEDDELHFFGDRIKEGGNDHFLALEIEKRCGFVYNVEDYIQTWEILSKYD